MRSDLNLRKLRKVRIVHIWKQSLYDFSKILYRPIAKKVFKPKALPSTWPNQSRISSCFAAKWGSNKHRGHWREKQALLQEIYCLNRGDRKSDSLSLAQVYRIVRNSTSATDVNQFLLRSSVSLKWLGKGTIDCGDHWTYHFCQKILILRYTERDFLKISY